MPQPRVFVSRIMHPDALAVIEEATDMEVWPDDPPPARRCCGPGWPMPRVC